MHSCRTARPPPAPSAGVKDPARHWRQSGSATRRNFAPLRTDPAPDTREENPPAPRLQRPRESSPPRGQPDKPAVDGASQVRKNLPRRPLSPWRQAPAPRLKYAPIPPPVEIWTRERQQRQWGLRG